MNTDDKRGNKTAAAFRRAVKQGWLINKHPKKQVDAIRAHVYLTTGMFNGTLAYRSREGEESAQECIRRYRVKTIAQARHKCMIVSGNHYAIFDLEELMTLLGQPVRCPMRTDEKRFRKLHGPQFLSPHPLIVFRRRPSRSLPIPWTASPCPSGLPLIPPPARAP